jgi:ribonucleotide monophosphatase NagD (HAD superfamily)
MPCLREIFVFLRERNIRFILATNNSTRTPQAYVDKLSGTGVSVSMKFGSSRRAQFWRANILARFTSSVCHR